MHDDNVRFFWQPTWQTGMPLSGLPSAHGLSSPPLQTRRLGCQAPIADHHTASSKPPLRQILHPRTCCDAGVARTAPSRGRSRAHHGQAIRVAEPLPQRPDQVHCRSRAPLQRQCAGSAKHQHLMKRPSHSSAGCAVVATSCAKTPRSRRQHPHRVQHIQSPCCPVAASASAGHRAQHCKNHILSCTMVCVCAQVSRRRSPVRPARQVLSRGTRCGFFAD